jgi:hypothetical protein
MWRILAKTLAMLVFVLIGLSPGTAKEFAPEGGSGGVLFRDLCPNGQYLVGTNAHTGNVVDQISITCAPVNPDGSTGAQSHGPNRGGPGGSTPNRPTTCADHEIISDMGLLTGDVPPHTVIRLIIFNCVSTTGTARHNLDIGDAPFFPTIQQNCPDGEAATGIQGRSGIYVDALGLICGPFTRPGGPSAGGCSGLAGEELNICNEHNVERAKHGVPPLNWSADLAKNAQDWVKGCHTSKDSNGNDFFCHQSKQFGCGTDPSYQYGENLSFGYPTQSGKEAVDLWYCEISAYLNDPGIRGGTVYGCDNNPNKVTGHFTQVVWRGSSKLGCAQNTCSLGRNSGTLWACEYDPAGNDLGASLDQNVPPLQGFAHAANIPESSAPQRTTAIISDVDLYDIPGGVGRVIGILRQGQKLPLIGCRADPDGALTADNNWCQVSMGWVWGSFIVRSHTR